MGKYRGYDDAPGWLARRVTDLEKRVGDRGAAIGRVQRTTAERVTTAQQNAVAAQNAADLAQQLADAAQAAADAAAADAAAVAAALTDAEAAISGDITAVVDSVKDGTVFEADTFSGVVVTGALIQTLATASTGIKLIGNELVGYDDNGDVTFLLDGDTGQVTIAGPLISGAAIIGSVFKTAATGERVEIGTNPLRWSTIAFHSGDPSELQPSRLFADVDENDNAHISIEGPVLDSGGDRAQIAVGRNGAEGTTYIHHSADNVFEATDSWGTMSSGDGTYRSSASIESDNFQFLMGLSGSALPGSTTPGVFRVHVPIRAEVRTPATQVQLDEATGKIGLSASGRISLDAPNVSVGGLLFRAASIVATVNSAGDFTWTLPDGGFPNATLFAYAIQAGDPNNYGHIGPVRLWDHSTKQHVHFRTSYSGPSLTNVPWRVFAVGT